MGLRQALEKHLLPTTTDKAEGEKLLSRVRSVQETFEDLADVVESTGLGGVVDNAMPIAGAVGEALAETLTPVKFVVKLLGKLTEINDPNELAYLACTLAYRQACLEVLPRILGGKVKLNRKSWRKAQPIDSYDFELFTLESATTSPFIRDAEKALEAFLATAPLNEAQRRKALLGVRERFVTGLINLLSHRDTSDRFAPLVTRLDLGNEYAWAHHQLIEHGRYQRWLFEQESVLGEPFALQDIYVNLDCGHLSWKQLNGDDLSSRSGRLDPFVEGGRYSVLEIVLDLWSTPAFKEVIVLQGPAGSGKSSFTKHLCCQLIKRGLFPIRIELRHLDFGGILAVEDALARAVMQAKGQLGSDDLFLGRRIFQESVRFGDAEICPYILILDGWDEIALTASQSFQDEVEKILARIRQAFLRLSDPPVRVLLAGRPTDAVARSGFLRSESMVLTLRPQNAEQLGRLFYNMTRAIEGHPLGEKTGWQPPSQSKLWTIQNRFKEDPARLELLGSPLLAFLAYRLLAVWPGDPEELIGDRTTLYRCLVDMVMAKAGKPEEVDFEPAASPMITGKNLRILLQRTAEAMNFYGTESLKAADLERFLDIEKADLDARVQALGEKQVLSRLLISLVLPGSPWVA